MIENDKTIFSYLKANCNDKISNLRIKELKDLLLYLNKYYLEYRDNIGIDLNDTFGIEIELEHFKGIGELEFLNVSEDINRIVGNEKWNVKNDISLVNGVELSSEILTDNISDWGKVKNVCSYSSSIGKIDIDCASHIHVGCQVLGENPLYWYRFLKLWSIYENIIYRFCYGEYLNHRPGIMTYAKPAALFYDSKLELLGSRLNGRVIDLIKEVESFSILDRFMNKYGISFLRMLYDNQFCEYDDYNKFVDGCSFELRVPNGTLDEIIWQNNINLFLKMINYCKSDNFNNDLLDRRRGIIKEIYSSLSAYSLIYLEQAVEFSDLIFDNNLDKIYFLRQYLKDFEISDKPYVKTKKFTYRD